MAKNRYINTAIWEDEWFVALDALEQHLFLYFLTNPSTNITGIYQLPLRRMQYETGMDQEKLKKIIGRLAADGKVFYELGWVILKNFLKHQELNGKTAIAVVNLFNDMPQWLRERLLDKNDVLFVDYSPKLLKFGYAIDRLSHNINSNSNSNYNLNFNFNNNGNSNAASAAKSQKGFKVIEEVKE